MTEPKRWTVYTCPDGHIRLQHRYGCGLACDNYLNATEVVAAADFDRLRDERDRLAEASETLAAVEESVREGFAAGRAAASPDPPPCRCPDDWRYDDGSVFCPRHSTKPDAPAPASPDPPNEDAIRADERERLSARVYENGWCGTCGRSIEQ